MKELIALWALAALSGAADPVPATRTDVSLAMADTFARAALAYARSHDLRLAIVVVDSNGRVVSVNRMDGVHPDIVDVARKKARAAVLMQQSTSAFADWPADRKVPLLALDDLLLVRGGIPIRHNGQVIGGLGASGASAENDEAAILFAAGEKPVGRN